MKRITQLRREIKALEDTPEQAVPQMMEAARLGDYESIHLLVSAYTHGELGLEPDPQMAAEYTRIGAELGEGWCQYNLAVSYRQGIGLEPDLEAARRWMLMAAEADRSEAYLPAAEMLACAQGGPQDLEEAARWCRKAMELAEPEDAESARILLGGLYNETGIVRMRQGDHQKAAQLFQEGLGLGNAECAVNLACEYSLEGGVGPEPEKTFQFSLQAAEAGQVMGMYNVSLCYQEGHGVRQDSRQAFEWMRNAAKTGLTQAWLPLARHYLEGVGVRPNLESALVWARKAQQAGIQPAQDVVQDILDRIHAS